MTALSSGIETTLCECLQPGSELGHPSDRDRWPLEDHPTISRKHLMDHRRSATFGRQDIRELGFPMGNG